MSNSRFLTLINVRQFLRANGFTSKEKSFNQWIYLKPEINMVCTGDYVSKIEAGIFWSEVQFINELSSQEDFDAIHKWVSAHPASAEQGAA